MQVTHKKNKNVRWEKKQKTKKNWFFDVEFERPSSKERL